MPPNNYIQQRLGMLVNLNKANCIDQKLLFIFLNQFVQIAQMWLDCVNMNRLHKSEQIA